jgi:hypothetical protein
VANFAAAELRGEKNAKMHTCSSLHRAGGERVLKCLWNVGTAPPPRPTVHAGLSGGIMTISVLRPDVQYSSKHVERIYVERYWRVYKGYYSVST